jgi:hypothetical protein
MIVGDTPFKKYRRKGWVYFARSGDLVKIGFTRSIRNRLRAIRSPTGERVDLMVYISGSMGLEQDLHNLCIAAHVTGEWFRLTPDVQRTIDEFSMNWSG